MKIQWGNIDKTEDKIIRVDGVESEVASTPFNDILWLNRLLPPLSILQLSDVWPKKTFKWNRWKALVVSDNEQYVGFKTVWSWGGGWDPTPVTLTYSANLTVDLSEHLNYILTLTGDCVLSLTDVVPWWVYQFLIIQDNTWWHTLTISNQCYYQQWYSQDTSPDSHSKLVIDNINNNFYASIDVYL